MAKKKRKSALSQFPKDVAMFSMGGILVGAGGRTISHMGAGAAGTHAASAMAELGSGMRAVAPLIPMKTAMGMLAPLTKRFKPRKRRR